jgi:hypothetical protein
VLKKNLEKENEKTSDGEWNSFEPKQKIKVTTWYY